MTSASIEMSDLSKRPESSEDRKPNSQNDPGDPADSVISTWTWVTASLLLLLALVLALSPRILLFISETGSELERRVNLTPLESFLATHFAVWLLAVVLTLVMNVPSALPPAMVPQQSTDHPLLVPSTLSGLVSAFLAYNTKSVGPLSSIVFVGAAIIGLWGLWAIVFGSSSRVSRKTGADKHTSSFIFGNKSSASAQKKKWLKDRKA